MVEQPNHERPAEMFGSDDVKERHTLERRFDLSDETIDDAETYLYNAIEAIQQARYEQDNEEVHLGEARSEIEAAWWACQG